MYLCFVTEETQPAPSPAKLGSVFSLPNPSDTTHPTDLHSFNTDTMSTLVFLTGASKGFGRALALEVAKAVPSHLALVRNPPPSCFFTARSS